jgi:mannose-6-phosphate isomerase
VTVLLARLEGVLRDYAWGSRHVLAALEGRQVPSAAPEAERWFGAHPTGPATLRLADGTAWPLDAAIAADPHGLLGPDVVARFGPRLPFLLKVLAAADPLSLQAHPPTATAQAGFADEEARGVPLDAPHRRYRDPWPKPELLRALTPVTALCGFRAPDRTRALLAELAVAELTWLADALRRDGDAAIAPVVRRLLTTPADQRRSLVAAVAERAAELPEDGWGPEAAVVRRLAARYPDDPGVLVALLMPLIHLAPGEALHLPAGNLHAYVEGAGVEVMATSDNVLRGGLTPKHVDVDELLQVLDDRPGEVPRVVAVPGVPGESVLPAPTPFFRLSELHPRPGAPVALERRGPQVLLCAAGRARVGVDDIALELRAGEAAFVAARAAEARVVTRGDDEDVLVFRATVGDA